MLDAKDHRLIMASLDVESLFTNIPLEETIEFLTNKVFDGKVKVEGLSKTDFRRLLTLSLQKELFSTSMVIIIVRRMVFLWVPRWGLH